MRTSLVRMPHVYPRHNPFRMNPRANPADRRRNPRRILAEWDRLSGTGAESRPEYVDRERQLMEQQANRPLTEKELATFKGMILPVYTLADIQATPAQARVAIAFLEAVRMTGRRAGADKHFADESVHVVPASHIQGGDDMEPNLIYEDIAQIAEHIMQTREWNRIERPLGCYLEMNNNYSASIVKSSRNNPAYATLVLQQGIAKIRELVDKHEAPLHFMEGGTGYSAFIYATFDVKGKMKRVLVCSANCFENTPAFKRDMMKIPGLISYDAVAD